MLRYKQITLSEVDFLETMVLRQADIDEMRVSTGFSKPWDALKYSIAHSSEWTEACYNDETGEIIMVFGLGKAESFGVPWMVGSPSMKKHKKVLMRYAKKVIEQMLSEFNELINYVDSRNDQHIHWLKHMGFKFDESKDVCIGKIPFRYFYKRRNE